MTLQAASNGRNADHSAVFDVVVPAGGLLTGAYRAAAGTPIRALAPIGADRQPVLQIVVNALRASGRVGAIVVVGDPSLAESVTDVDSWLPESPPEPGDCGGPRNILAGLSRLPKDRTALVCTSDLPFLSPEGVRDFTAKMDGAAEITVGLTTADAYLARYPESPPSRFVPVLETGPVTMACLFAVVPDILLRNHRTLYSAFAARKSLWRMAGLVGPGIVWQLALGRLSAEAVRSRVQKILSCRAGLVLDARPDLAFDIDTVEDYSYAASRKAHAAR